MAAASCFATSATVCTRYAAECEIKIRSAPSTRGGGLRGADDMTWIDRSLW